MSHVVCPHHGPHPWVEYFLFPPFNALMFGQGQCCAGTNGSGDKGQERAFPCFHQRQSLTPYPGSHSCGMPSWGGQGEVKAQRVSSAFTKGITLWPAIPLLGAVGMTGEKKEKHTKKKLIYYPKGFFPLFILSVRASDVLQMGQDLIFPPYTKVSARSCCSSCLD